MTEEQKHLLLNVLCAMLPYGVKVMYKDNIYDLNVMYQDGRTYLGSYNSIYGSWSCDLKYDTYPIPYLRPMSNMNPDEKDTWMKYKRKIAESDDYTLADNIAVLHNWLNKNHFDIQHLIEKGLALVANDNMYI